MNQRILFIYWLCQDFYIVQMTSFGAVYYSLQRLFQKFFSEKGESVINIFSTFFLVTLFVFNKCIM